MEVSLKKEESETEELIDRKFPHTKCEAAKLLVHSSSKYKMALKITTYTEATDVENLLYENLWRKMKDLYNNMLP